MTSLSLLISFKKKRILL